jgi:adenylate cyclase
MRPARRKLNSTFGVVADVDIEALGLLDGFEGDARRDRAELIAWLLDRGFSIDQIRASGAAPMLLPANRLLGDDGIYVSAREACEATGIDLEVLQRLQRAVGLPRVDDPDAAVLPRADAEAVTRAKVFLDLGIAPDETVAVMRVLVEGLEHAAAMMRQAALTALLRPGSGEIELAEAIEEMARQAAPMLGPMMEDLLLMQLRHSFEYEAINAAERAAGTLPGARQVTVAFADVAGFTRLGEALPPEDLEQVASQLTELAHDVAAPPVRFIKTIGDAVMHICPDPVPLLHAILELAGAATAIGLPRLRIGVASGCAVSRAGDWFGSPVNVASRVTGAASPGTALVAESTRDAVGNAAGFEWSPAGARRLKGLSGEVKLFRVEAGTGLTPRG